MRGIQVASTGNGRRNDWDACVFDLPRPLVRPGSDAVVLHPYLVSASSWSSSPSECSRCVWCVSGHPMAPHLQTRAFT